MRITFNDRMFLRAVLADKINKIAEELEANAYDEEATKGKLHDIGVLEEMKNRLAD